MGWTIVILSNNYSNNKSNTVENLEKHSSDKLNEISR